MNINHAEINIYGAEQSCSSCIQMPSSKDTFEWLQAAIARKYPSESISISYIDIYCPPDDEAAKKFAQRILKEGMFYPVVVINGKIICEGNPSLKAIFKELDS